MQIRIRNIAARLGLVLGSLLIMLLLLEGLLQVGAWYKRSTQQELPNLWSTSHLRILCVGDSNTYGMWMGDRALAYPARLESIWNESGHMPKIEALNLGYPGNNSSRLLQNLPKMLESLHPDLVIVMVGANDFWTEPVEIQEGGTWSKVGAFLRQESRVYRLAYMIGRSFKVGEVHLETEEIALRKDEWTAQVGGRQFELGHATRNPQEHMRATSALMRNLESASELTEREGARIILMTYPSRQRFYAVSNKQTRAVAKQTGTTLIDLAKTFAAICPNIECAELLFKDQHPRAEGYLLVADTIRRELSKETFR